jgi:hypothetical protein
VLLVEGGMAAAAANCLVDRGLAWLLLADLMGVMGLG